MDTTNVLCVFETMCKCKNIHISHISQHENAKINRPATLYDRIKLKCTGESMRFFLCFLFFLVSQWSWFMTMHLWDEFHSFMLFKHSISICFSQTHSHSHNQMTADDKHPCVYGIHAALCLSNELRATSFNVFIRFRFQTRFSLCVCMSCLHVLFSVSLFVSLFTISTPILMLFFFLFIYRRYVG